MEAAASQVMEAAAATADRPLPPRRARPAICLLSVMLVLLQGALYLQHNTWLISSAPREAAAAAAVAAAAAAAVVAREATAAATVGRWQYNQTEHVVSPEALAFVASLNPNASSKDCGQTTGDFPRNRILIVHEQHLQSMGCDVRLLRFIKDLVYLNQEVSMFFRGNTPSKMRQPKSKQLASILHIADFEEDQFRKGLRYPPGLYEWTTTQRFAQLMALGYFNMVVVFLWFWYDPQPSAAELVLPLVRAHAPADKQAP